MRQTSRRRTATNRRRYSGPPDTALPAWTEYGGDDAVACERCGRLIRPTQAERAHSYDGHQLKPWNRCEPTPLVASDREALPRYDRRTARMLGLVTRADVAREYGVSLESMTGLSRARNCVWPEPVAVVADNGHADLFHRYDVTPLIAIHRPKWVRR